MPKTAIQPTRAQNYAEWYQQVIKAADMAEVSPVRGCMIIKPWGYAIWELIQQQLDQRIKQQGHDNIYCPLFIPLSFLEKEADHVEGFAKECAVVTHSRLVSNDAGGLTPASPLEEPLVVRPTSEALIGEAFSRWIQSHRDLPLGINQWANIVRWEMRTRMFLRTSEFLWQEGHTAHAQQREADQQARDMLDVYAEFAENVLAMPVIKGEKSPSERFPGAQATYCIEAMMQDKKALQAGTSHFLGQSFAKAFDIQFSNDQGQHELAWTTSWGVSTRLIGGLIMTHADDDGLVLPPRVAPQHIVIMPIVHHDGDHNAIMDACENLAKQCRQLHWQGAPVRVKIDRQLHVRGRAWQWVKKGVPIRIEIGSKELANGTACVSLRHQPYQQKMMLETPALIEQCCQYLDEIQQHCLQQATQFQQQNIERIDDEQQFYAHFHEQQHDPGFVLCHWDGTEATEQRIKNDLKVTIRCIPWDMPSESGACPFSGKPSQQRVIWARSY